MPGVSGVPERGYRDREMLVEVNLAKLNDYHISLNDVINALSGKNIDFPGGIAKTGSEEILIRTIGQVETAPEISRIIIRSNDIGVPVKISDVANVKDSFEEEREIAKTMGEKSINLTVRIKENYDIIKLVTSVRKEVRSFEKNMPENYKIVETDDLSQYVVRRLDVLKGNAAFGFALVIATLLFAFGWRIALVAAMGIPLSFAGTFFWMETANVSINLMSMFGLIMVLGMLVDDAIVVSENIYRLIEEKVPLKQAVVQGTSEVIVPVAGTILTTIVAFAPLMFMSGIIGKFVWVLPAVVSAALLFSWFESMLILPGHIYDMEKKRAKHHTSKKPEDIHSPLKIRKRYKVLLTATVRNKYKTAGLIFVIFFASILFGATHLKFDLFPATGIEKFVIKLESKSGTALEEMNTRVIAIEKLVSELPEKELDSFTTTVGVSQIEEGDPDTKRGSNYASIVVNLTPETDRDRIASDIVDKMRQDMNQFSNLFPKIEVHLAKNGPPTGMPVSVAVKGDDIATLKEISKEFKDYLKTIKGVKDVKDNYELSKKELHVRVKPEIAARAGVSVYDVATAVRSCYDGTVATKIKKTEEEIGIRVILPENMRRSLNSLKTLKVSNKQGNLVPLNQIATFSSYEGISVISHNSFRRNIQITADIDPTAKGVSSVSVNVMLQKKFSDIPQKYTGYTVNYEGEFKDTQESMGQLLKSFIIALMGIYIILVAVFRNLYQPAIVMAVIPLSAIGLVWSFWSHSLPLSFMGLMGIVGLCGVVVNDSIVYVDFINKERGEGIPLEEAIIDAGFKRIRPILLTTITTVFGLMPTAYGIGGYDPFIKPMAIAMSWGLVFGVVITLFVTPVIYGILYDCKGILNRLKGKRICEDAYSAAEQTVPTAVLQPETESRRRSKK